MMDFFDYTTLRLIWWGLLGALLIGFALADGFDLGVATLLTTIGKTDSERRVVINTVGPVWEGNQVWLILGGGAIFAAWPALYALSFSGFYLAMFLTLTALIVRPVAFKFRSKRPEASWRNRWDYVLVYSGLIPALIFGVAMGNVLQGVPFYFDDNLRPFYTGNLLGLLNPFALLAGLVSVALLVTHGALYLTLKTDGVIQQRAQRIAGLSGVVAGLLYAGAGVWLSQGLVGYQVTHAQTDGPSNPLYKTVELVQSGLIDNYANHPVLWLVPILGIGASLVASLLARWSWHGWAFVSNKLAITSVITSVGISLFPILLPSSTHPSHSLSVFDSSSSETTLFIMLICTVIFLPLILMYTAWVYKVLWGRVRETDLKTNSNQWY